MNTGSHTEHHSSHKTSDASQSSSQIYSTAPSTGAGFTSAQGAGLGQSGLTNGTGTGTGGNTGFTGNASNAPGSGYSTSGYGNQTAPASFPEGTQGQGDVGRMPPQSINAGGASSLPVQNTGVGTTTKAGTDVAGRHPNPTHVSNQYRPGTTYNTAPVAADGAQLHGPPPPAYKEGHNSSVNLPEINPRRV